MKLNPEDILQISVNEFCLKHKIPMFHFANERQCNFMHGSVLSRKGVQPGVNDCFFPRSNHQYKDMWGELKTRPNKPTSYQKKFARERTEEGSFCWWADNLDDAIKYISEFYGLNIEPLSK